jgi:queuine/archaeosine tRNA-ribosyltransferase
MHGDNIEQMEDWYKNTKDFNFDGWASGMKPPYDPMLQAMCVMFLYEKGELFKEKSHGLHFFGISGRTVVPTVIYLANKLDINLVTFDSSSFNNGSKFRAYMPSNLFGDNLYFGDRFVTENPEIKTLPCTCPVCRVIDDDIKLLNGTDILAGTLLSLHNMYQYISYNKILNSLVKNKQKYFKYLEQNNIGAETFRSFEFIDYCFERGFYNGLKKYDVFLNQQSNDKLKQANIFNF